LITIIDYGLGNVQAIQNIYRKLDVPVALAKTNDDLQAATHLVLPGVGAFDWAMARLNDSGMRGALDELVLGQGVPVLGICVGMQMMARQSEEGTARGLAWIDAVVKRFDTSRMRDQIRLPHMGWNDIDFAQANGLLRGLEVGARFYFLHSFYFLPNNNLDVLAWANYGGPFACAVRKGNIFGVQFHPEKSHTWGIQLLKNFASL
jgi:glutamine amidotransferase